MPARYWKTFQFQGTSDDRQQIHEEALRDDDAGTLAYALAYARAGLQVFPVFGVVDGHCGCGNATCESAGKHPAVAGGFHAATCDATQIEAWWRARPDFNVGIATGRRSGIFVVDVDPRHGGDRTLQELLSEQGSLGQPAISITGGGGQHLVYRAPVAPVSSKAGALLGIDRKSEGGYIVAPPSLHASGRRYEWLAGEGLFDLELAEPPAWLLQVLTEERRRSSSDDDGDVPSIPDGQRGDALFRMASSMRARGFGAAAIEAALRQVNATQCRPPISDGRLADIVASVKRYPVGRLQRGNNADTPRPHVVQALNDGFRTAAEHGHDDRPVDWLVEGLVARGAVTLLTGRAKVAGKTTLVGAMIAAMLRGVPFVGLPVTRTPVVLLSEEGTATLGEFLDRSGLRQEADLHILSHRSPSVGATFLEYVDVAARRARETGAGLVVVDTLADFLGLRRDAENEAGSVLNALRPLLDQTTGGLGILLVHHEGKGASGIGDGGRGSSAFAGAVDVILSLRRPDVGTVDTLRTLHGVSRFSATPSCLHIDLQPGGYVRRDDPAVVTAATEQALLHAAPHDVAGALTAEQLILSAGVNESTGRKVIRALVERGSFLRVGRGVRGEPAKFWAATVAGASPIQEGQETSGASGRVFRRSQRSAGGEQSGGGHA